jgi:hypothetical protein
LLLLDLAVASLAVCWLLTVVFCCVDVLLAVAVSCWLRLAVALLFSCWLLFAVICCCLFSVIVSCCFVYFVGFVG